MGLISYAVGLMPAEEGGFVVSCRDLPQVVTQGEDLEHALAQAADAMDEVFAAYMQGGLVFPMPTETRKDEHVVSPPAETMAEAALYMAMKNAGVGDGSSSLVGQGAGNGIRSSE